MPKGLTGQKETGVKQKKGIEDVENGRRVCD